MTTATMTITYMAVVAKTKSIHKEYCIRFEISTCIIERFTHLVVPGSLEFPDLSLLPECLESNTDEANDITNKTYINVSYEKA